VIREWREARTESGLPNSLEDYYAAHGLCFDCQAHGAQMIGWSEPVTPVDFQAADDFSLEKFPLYDVCPTCQGTGKVDETSGSSS
jgi:hypothetical protein